jgi:APA family basic amino acid/polyamine antiporter
MAKKKRRSNPRPARRGLHRELGLWPAMALVVGTMIGAGILATPGQVAGGMGSAPLTLVAWALGGAYALAGALCCAELASAVPQAGGFYTFARRAIGRYAGFTAGWMDCLTMITAIAWLGAIAGGYTAQLAPAAATWSRAVGIAVILVLAAWHWASVRASGTLQTVLSAAKYVAILAVVVVGLMAPRADLGASAGAAPATTFAGVALALQSVVFAYAGWYGAIYVAEEVRDPARVLPRALAGGVGAVTALYLLVNVSFLLAMPIPRMATSKLVAADVAELALGGNGARVITAVALLTVVGTISGLLVNGSRIAFAMARNHELPRAIAAVNAGGSPTGGIALVAGAAAVMLAVVGSPDSLFSICAFLLVLVFSTGFVSVWRLRQKEPKLPRPYRVAGVPWLPAALLAVSAALIAGFWIGDPRSSAWATGFVLASYPIYRLVRRS